MRWKLTYGRDRLGRPARSPCGTSPGSSCRTLTASSTSVETSLIRASGGLCGLRLRTGRGEREHGAASQPSVLVMDIWGTSSGRCVRDVQEPWSLKGLAHQGVNARTGTRVHRAGRAWSQRGAEAGTAGGGVAGAAAGAPDAGVAAAGGRGCRRPRRQRPTRLPRRRRRLGNVAVEDEAAPPLQVGVANEGVLVERDVVDHPRRAEQAGAGVDDRSRLKPICVLVPSKNAAARRAGRAAEAAASRTVDGPRIGRTMYAPAPTP